MELEKLELLEEKINQAVQLIERLKMENKELKQLNDDLREENMAKDRMIQQLKEENQHLHQMQLENTLGTEKEEEIKSKIEQILNQLDELELNL
ncbi:MAG: cell division protein ZapB [Calditrichaeota bacterium]|nr:MAG: cell division protein ZapB [Calditrichota bacterium]